MELNNQVNEQPQNTQRTPASDFKVYNMTSLAREHRIPPDLTVAGGADIGPPFFSAGVSELLQVFDSIKEAFSPKVEFTAGQRRGSAEGVIQVIERNRGVFAIVSQHYRAPITTGDVDAPSRPYGRSKDEILNSLKPDGFAAWLTGQWVKPGKNVLVVPDKIESVFVEQR